VIETGYPFILIEKKIDQTYFVNTRALQILKAVKECVELPADTVCEPVDSDIIKSFLKDTQTDYFVILKD
jgi:hypothetical protein